MGCGDRTSAGRRRCCSGGAGRPLPPVTTTVTSSRMAPRAEATRRTDTQTRRDPRPGTGTVRVRPGRVVYPAWMATVPHPASADVGYLGVADLARSEEVGTLTSAGTDRHPARADRRRSTTPPAPVGLRAIAALADDARFVAAERDAERSRGALRGPLHGGRSWSRTTSKPTGSPASPAPPRSSAGRQPMLHWSPG